MKLGTRLAKITARQSDAVPIGNDWIAIELNARAGFGYKMEDLWSRRNAPMSFSAEGRRMVFVDFCPGGVVANRQDVPWLQQGICAYDFFADEEQRNLFGSIAIGDLLIMKKDEIPKKTMLLTAHGPVTGMGVSDEGERVLHVSWSHEYGQTEAPAFGFGKLVCIPDVEMVNQTMPVSFWRWLQK